MKKLRKIYFMLEILLLAIECGKQVKKLFKKKKERKEEDDDEA